MAKCVVIPTGEGVGIPLFHYTRMLMETAGHDVGSAEIDDPLDGARLVVAFGDACRRAADVGLGVWLSPNFRDPSTATALRGAKGPGLIVGSLDDLGWDRATAARLRQYEILHLTRANRFFEIPGDPMGSIDVMRQVLGRMSDMISRVG